MKYKVKLRKPQVIDKYKVYFDLETGNILSITNKTDNTKNTFFEIPVQEAEDFVLGTRNLTSHKVVFNVKEQKYEITHKDDSIIVYADDLIFRINKVNSPQIIITQDIKNEKWILSVADEIKQTMKSVQSRLEEYLFFSITEKRNPNILYAHFYTSIKDLVEQEVLEIPFTSQEEQDFAKISVYTNRKFDRYSHEVINE